MRVAACCSLNPRRTRGVGFRTHAARGERVSRAIFRAHKARVSCVYPMLMSFCDVRAWGGGQREAQSETENEREGEREGDVERVCQSERENADMRK